MNRFAAGYALLSAALFGLSTPLAKWLIGGIDPWLLAGLLYLGSGLGLAFFRVFVRGTRGEAAVARADLPWLAGAVISGGVIGPVLLLLGLARIDGANASLFLTFESAATALIAWFVFRENFDRRIALGMAAIVLGAIVLARPDTATISDTLGALCVLGACLAWAIDNNLTRKVSLADPVQVAMIKGLAAGPVNVALAFAIGAGWPAIGMVPVAALVGFLGYGVSLVLFVLALRHLGTARTGAYYATAPFLGATGSIAILNEPITGTLLVAGGLMALGAWLHLTERHEHEHEHTALAHAHRHRHDEHHRHHHAPDDPTGEPHSHVHVHRRLRHAHAHTPDAHHRHAH